MANINDYRDYLQHSQGPWKKHKYIEIVTSANGKKWYKYAKGAYDRLKTLAGNAKTKLGQYKTLADKYAKNASKVASKYYNTAKKSAISTYNNKIKPTAQKTIKEVAKAANKTSKQVKTAADTISKNASKKVSEIKKTANSTAKKVANDVSYAVNKKSNEKKMAETRAKVNAQNKRKAGLMSYDKEAEEYIPSDEFEKRYEKLENKLENLPDKIYDKLERKYGPKMEKLSDEVDRAYFDVEGTDRVEYASITSGAISQLDNLMKELDADIEKEKHSYSKADTYKK